MSNKFKIFSFGLTLLIVVYLGVSVFNYFIPYIVEKKEIQTELKNELSISPIDYNNMTTTLEEERDSLVEQINRQTDTINNVESSMAFLMKEDILNKISNAVKNTGAEFDNFYVTFEGSIKNDYSVQVKGNIYQINQFIENLFVGTPGISIGEFSIREDDTANFLSRYFDNSDALMWYDGSIYKSKNTQKTEISEEEIEEVKREVQLKLPNAEKILYVLTLTFRV